MITRRTFAAALAAVSSLALTKSAKADGAIQTVHNGGQIVSNGSVHVTQAAGGQQYVYDQYGSLIAVEDVGNDLQVVSNRDVTVDQSAAGSQAVSGGGGQGNRGTCTPGDYYEQGGCAYFCGQDGCTWYQHCCQACPKQKGKCCK